MRYTAEHKAQTRRKILEAGAKLFRRDGFQATGIDAVMAEAGLTAGAFYRHFSSKEALLEAVLDEALDRSADQREQGLDELQGREWVAGLVENYLSLQHWSSAEDGCPLPALVPELARAGDGCHEAFARGISRWRREIGEHLGELPPHRRQEVALGLISTMVGGMALARGLEQEQAEVLLSGARATAKASLQEDIS